MGFLVWIGDFGVLMEGIGLFIGVWVVVDIGLLVRNGFMVCCKLVIGLGFVFFIFGNICSWFIGSLIVGILCIIGVIGMMGIGGGFVFVMDCFCCWKNDDVFFCSVCVVEWCDLCDGGVDDFGCSLSEEVVGVIGGVEMFGVNVVLVDLNIFLKKFCFFFGCMVVCGGIRFVFFDFL